MQVKFAAAKTVIVEGCEGKFAPVELIRLGMN
ncbi:selenium-binding protein YdfZ [Salmonella enterica subsp. arizonae]|uniref:Selenium-binding protein YdfZ n=1 Tax=Salmonella enterica subsp. arizonae TaxID=59203 RepID=A0A379TBW7_SALER|nr:selenium-binding protein YdfZ [Salmonella enterica subsp. arizonae]VUC84730.1 selenium-binding protein YdfZ [Salmonella sp. NCTC 11881]